MNFNIVKNQVKRLGFVYNGVHHIYTFYLSCLKNWKRFKCREKKYSYGDDNPDKTFYVIGVNHTSAGLFAIVKSISCHVIYAIQKGYIPVIDMQNFRSQLNDGVKQSNAWEAYYKQPCNYGLGDIKHSKNIVVSSSLPYPDGVEIGFDTTLDKNSYDKYHDLFKQYIVPNVAVATYADMKYASVIADKKQVLGVLCRGTDYTENKPVGHSIQPSPQQAIDKVREVMAEQGFEYVFLATEDRKIFDHFKHEFGDKLLFSGQKLYDGMNGKKYLSEIPVSCSAEKWQNIVDYYATIYILSKCDGLVAGLTCGSICSYFMTDGYEYVYFWNLGKY